VPKPQIRSLAGLTVEVSVMIPPRKPWIEAKNFSGGRFDRPIWNSAKGRKPSFLTGRSNRLDRIASGQFPNYASSSSARGTNKTVSSERAAELSDAVRRVSQIADSDPHESSVTFPPKWVENRLQRSRNGDAKETNRQGLQRRTISP